MATSNTNIKHVKWLHTYLFVLFILTASNGFLALNVLMIDTGVLMGTGDIVAQTVVERQPRKINLSRTLPYAFVGLGVGPFVGAWYKILERVCGSNGSLRVALKKIAMDQLLLAPPSLATILCILDYMKGHSIDEIKTDLRTKYVDIMITNYKVWPLVQLVNFYFVPLHLRVLFVQSIAVLWVAYLSWKIK